MAFNNNDSNKGKTCSQFSLECRNLSVWLLLLCNGFSKSHENTFWGSQSSLGWLSLVIYQKFSFVEQASNGSQLQLDNSLMLFFLSKNSSVAPKLNWHSSLLTWVESESFDIPRSLLLNFKITTYYNNAKSMSSVGAYARYVYDILRKKKNKLFSKT